MQERYVKHDQTFLNDHADMPLYPILDPTELGELHDYRHQLPLDLRNQLSNDDYVIHIVTPSIQTPYQKPSALREIIRIANAPSLDEVGRHGGPVASRSHRENDQVEALRKFEVLHGRDALEISIKLQDRFPELLKTTLISLAETQGLVQEEYLSGTPFRQEEPGRIMLLDRHPNDLIGQKFREKLNWGWPFYGSIDATPTFISGIAQYTLNHDPDFLNTLHQARDGEAYPMRDALTLSTEWLLGKLDSHPEGLLEFKNMAESGGMDAQAWKDSAFAYVHADGTRANLKDGVASIEVQALAYDALLDAATLLRHDNIPALADILEAQAEELKKRIFKTFWVEDRKKGGYFALGADRDPKTNQLRTLNVRSSNMGHLLQSRLLEETDDESVRYMRDETVRQLFSPELLHSCGIRTLASDEVAFRAGGYHTGSVWPWDTERIASGLERHNFHHLAWELRARIWRIPNETGKFSEFVRSDGDNSIQTNLSEIYVWNDKHKVLHLFEQPPQEVQGWTVSAILASKYKYPNYLKMKDQLPTSYVEQSILLQLN